MRSRLLVLFLGFILVGAYLLAGRSDRIRPGRGAAARGSEPGVKVGVILPADEMSYVDLVLPAGEYEIRGGKRSGTHVISEETQGRISVGENGAELTFGSAPLVGSYYGNPVSIEPAGESTNGLTGRSGGGIVVRDIVAGRSFHWRKRIDQRLPGSLRFYRERDQNGGGRDYLTVVNELPVETYLAGVITSEMSGACPAAFLESQAVVARSWLFNVESHRGKHAGRSFSVCNDDHCQRYQGNYGMTEAAARAVERTRGLVIRNAEGTLCNAMYSKSCGGSSADPSLVWRKPIAGCRVALDAPDRSGSNAHFPVTEENAFEWFTGAWPDTAMIFCSPRAVPEEDLSQYLGRVDDSGPYFRWTISYTEEELAALLRRDENFADLDRVSAIQPAGRGPSGRLHAVAVRYETESGATRRRLIEGQNSIRALLHSSFLYSSAFVVDHAAPTDSTEERFTLHGGGWGHGVGLCQTGALGMALAGYELEQIIAHYYAGVALEKQYD